MGVVDLVLDGCCAILSGEAVAAAASVRLSIELLRVVVTDVDAAVDDDEGTDVAGFLIVVVTKG